MLLLFFLGRGERGKVGNGNTPPLHYSLLSKARKAKRGREEGKAGCSRSRNENDVRSRRILLLFPGFLFLFLPSFSGISPASPLYCYVLVVRYCFFVTCDLAASLGAAAAAGEEANKRREFLGFAI